MGDYCEWKPLGEGKIDKFFMFCSKPKFEHDVSARVKRTEYIPDPATKAVVVYDFPTNFYTDGKPIDWSKPLTPKKGYTTSRYDKKNYYQAIWEANRDSINEQLSELRTEVRRLREILEKAARKYKEKQKELSKAERELEISRHNYDVYKRRYSDSDKKSHLDEIKRLQRKVTKLETPFDDNIYTDVVDLLQPKHKRGTKKIRINVKDQLEKYRKRLSVLTDKSQASEFHRSNFDETYLEKIVKATNEAKEVAKKAAKEVAKEVAKDGWNALFN